MSKAEGNARWYAKHGREYHQKWKARTRLWTGVAPKDRIRVGYICELLAVADMSARCGLAYLNPLPFTKDDAFVRTSAGWLTAQIKKGLVYKTGAIGLEGQRNSAKFMTSDIVAIVDFDGKRIRYKSNRKPLPIELPTKPAPLCEWFPSLIDGTTKSLNEVQ